MSVKISTSSFLRCHVIPRLHLISCESILHRPIPLGELTRVCRCEGVMNPSPPSRHHHFRSLTLSPALSSPTLSSRTHSVRNPPSLCTSRGLVAARAEGSLHHPLPAGSWPGLATWRSAPPRTDWVWGEEGPVSPIPGSTRGGPDPGIPGLTRDREEEDLSLVGIGREVLSTPCVERKLALTHLAHQLWEEGRLCLGEVDLGSLPPSPAVPDKPELVHPRAVPKPGKKSPLPLSAHLVHTLAHVELNAVHLAWDTAVRFVHVNGELGRHFFGDFLRVAHDEARHFGWCQQRLQELGFKYGDMPAHNLLWVDCAKSSKKVEHRLAVIPMVQEARGLDAGPRLIERLTGANDPRSAAVVRQICAEEMAHVAVGVAWFGHVCQLLGVEQYCTFRDITKELFADGVKGPFNHEARQLAGLPQHWYDPTLNQSESSVEVDKSLPSPSSGKNSTSEKLFQVRERLASIVAMEVERVV